MTVHVTLKEYLKSLKEIEAKKPITSRKIVPTIKDLVEFCGTTESNYYKFLRNEQKDINRGFLSRSIKLLKICGFDTNMQDVLHFSEDDDHIEALKQGSIETKRSGFNTSLLHRLSI